jgi:hypothetical protein
MRICTDKNTNVIPNKVNVLVKYSVLADWFTISSYSILILNIESLIHHYFGINHITDMNIPILYELIVYTHAINISINSLKVDMFIKFFSYILALE